ncbi:hypothetical protein [Dactylosporangium sp. NPDC051541]|uniref:hypothetical protein n=1 Tax=Dactylosporangium sp. NPDC051541 TaxID=3363977 RepID=UPI0037BA2237
MRRVRVRRVAGRAAPAPAQGGELRRVLLTAGSELAFVTGLLYYFGWVRTQVQADRLGFAAGALNLSVADYLLKSVNVLFPVLALLLLLILLAHVAFTALLRRWKAIARPRPVWSRMAAVLAVLCGIGGVLLSLPPWENRFAVPAEFTLAVLLAMAGRALKIRATREEPWTPARRWLVTLLLLLLLFWNTERVAMYFGEQYAADYKARPGQFPAVTVYSRDDLHLAVEGVRASKLDERDDGALRYCYTGLRLMESTADRYVLINEAWRAGRGRVLVVMQNDSIRVEFPGDCPAPTAAPTSTP